MLKNKDWIKTFEDTNPKGNLRKMTDKGMMFISTPKEIEELIKKVPKGKLTTTKIIAEKLSKTHKVDFTCPLTTGIFSSIIANKAEQEIEMGKKNVTPYWRVVKDKGYLYDKYLGTPSKQKAYLEKEGFKIVPSGTKKGPIVKNIEKFLV